METIKLMILSNEMFKGSKPMSGEELRILRKTSSRLISKTPTTLNKEKKG
jgi:hypothetical protein